MDYTSGDLNVTETRVNLVPCDASNFKGLNSASGMYIYEGLCMGKNESLTLFGSYSSLLLEAVNIIFDYCDQDVLNSIKPGTKCKNQSESNILIPDIIVQIAVLTSYFDQSRFDGSSIIPQTDLGMAF